MNIAFLFYEGMTALDAIGPHEILCRLPDTTVQRVAQHPGPIRTDSGLVLTADYGLSDVSHADVLLIPGAGSATTLRQFPDVLAWVRATSHWAALDRLRQWGAEPVSSRIVEDGRLMTAAGVSAGIDMALALAAKLAGQQVAERLQLGIEYDPNPPFDVGSPDKADPAVVEKLRARMVALFEGV